MFFVFQFLGFSTEEQTVHEHFEKCGEIISVRIVRDSKTGIGKGFCYVNFKDLKSVAKAVDLMNNTSLSGRKLRVSKSVNRPKKTIKVDLLLSRTLTLLVQMRRKKENMTIIHQVKFLKVLYNFEHFSNFYLQSLQINMDHTKETISTM